LVLMCDILRCWRSGAATPPAGRPSLGRVLPAQAQTTSRRHAPSQGASCSLLFDSLAPSLGDRRAAPSWLRACRAPWRTS
jgi:hypothetical protein